MRKNKALIFTKIYDLRAYSDRCCYPLRPPSFFTSSVPLKCLSCLLLPGGIVRISALAYFLPLLSLYFPSSVPPSLCHPSLLADQCACLPCIVNIRDEILPFSLSFAHISNNCFPLSPSHTHGRVPHSNPLLRDTHPHTHIQSHSHRSPSLFLCRCLRASQLRRGLTSLPALSTCSHGW